MLKTLKEINVTGKRILVRCDFNVPLGEKGDILDDFRIKQSLPTINYLLENKAKVVLISHLDPESTGTADKKYNLNKVAEKLSEHLGFDIEKSDDCVGPEVESAVEKLEAGRVLLLENLRFYREEIAGDEGFAKKLSYLGDIYVNDAFSVCHRNHASIAVLPKFLPKCAGLLLLKEITALGKVMQNPERPMVAIVGGKKVETKSEFINKILETADIVIISGLLKKEILEKNINFRYPEKIIGPKENLDALDIDKKTAEMFAGKIKAARTILWNGPFGKFEDKKYAKGTLAIAEAIVKSKAFSVAGGGETVEFIAKNGMLEKFSHVSTGGGAMLAYLAGENLPGLEALGK